MPVLVAPELVAMVAMLACIIAWMLLYTAKLWLQPLTNALYHPSGSLWKRIIRAPIKYGLAPIARFTYHYTVSFLAWSVHGIVKPAVKWWHSLTGLLDVAMDWLESFPAEVHWALYHLRHIVIPHLIHVAVAPVAALAADAKQIAVDVKRDGAAIAATVADALNGIDWRTVEDPVGALRNLAHAFTHLWRYTYGELTSRLHAAEALAGRLGSDLTDLERYIRDRIAGRLTDAEQALTDLGKEVYGDLKPYLDALRAGILPLGLVGAIVAALAVVWDGIFCRNMNQLGRHMCGLGSAEVDEALVGLFAVAALADFQEYVRLAQGATQATAEGVRELLQV